MFGKRILLIIFVYVSFQVSLCLKLNESEEEVLKRLNYFQKYSEKITNGKISFDFDEGKGIYCKAIQDIKKNEVVFRIPKEFILSLCKLF